MIKPTIYIQSTRARRGSLCSALSLVLTLLLVCLAPNIATAKEEPAYEYRPDLSLIGACGASKIDPVEDPGCPGGTHPPSGQFKRPNSIAIDAYGDEYVAVEGNESGTEGHIEIFDDEGRFLSELSDPYAPYDLAVDKKGVLYVFELPAASAEAEVARYYPTKYDPASGSIEYDATTRTVIDAHTSNEGSITIDPSTGRLFASFGTLHVQEYASAEELASPSEPNRLLNAETLTDPYFGSVGNLAVDAQRRRLFVSACKRELFECGVRVYKEDFPYEFVTEIDGSSTPATEFASTAARVPSAVDEETGHLFVADVQSAHRIFEFGPNFEYISTIEEPFLETYYGQLAVSDSTLNPTAANRHYVFIPIWNRSGLQEAFAFSPSNVRPPMVEGLQASSISENEAQVRATVAPRGAETHYVVQVQEAGSGEARLAGEGTIAKDSLPTEIVLPLTGLTAGASYEVVLAATNVKGSAQADISFSTYASSPVSGGCANESLRMGWSAFLPDCRVFELVTPADTNGRPVRGGGYAENDAVAMARVAPSGDAATFITEGGPLPAGEGTGSLSGDRYRASRGSSGWSTVHAGPSGTEAETPNLGATSGDQGYGFWTAFGDGSAVIGGFPNSTSYVEYPEGHEELLGKGSLGIDQNAIGELIAEDATHVVFQTDNANGNVAQQLESNAPPEGTATVYDRTPNGVTHVVSLLPGDVTPNAGENASYVGGSPDGIGILFNIGETLYVRVDDRMTYKIGDGVVNAGVSEAGRRVFYVKAGNLFAFDTHADETIAFTGTGDVKVVNVAPDGSRAYFISPSVVGEAGENPNGALPQAGQQNLYLSEEGKIRFVATVTTQDVEGEDLTDGFRVGLGLWTTGAEAGKNAAEEASRVDPSGSTLVFESSADLDGYAHPGVNEIYRYDSRANRLNCISCIPTKTAASGGASLETFGALPTEPPPFGAGVFVANMTPDGRRVVFQSKEALVSADTDGVQDIYEWEQQGVGNCQREGGCVYLISSGVSAHPNYLYGVSNDGADVFFITNDVLVGGDNDTASLYDARVDGGFAVSSANAECLGEACQPAANAPAFLTPASVVFEGLGNVQTATVKHRSARPSKVCKHSKAHCAKKRRKRYHRARKHGHKRHNSSKGAGK